MTTRIKKIKRTDHADHINKKPRYEPIVKKFLITTTYDCRYIKKIEIEFDNAQSCDDLYYFPFELPLPEIRADLSESTSIEIDRSLNFDQSQFDDFTSFTSPMFY